MNFSFSLNILLLLYLVDHETNYFLHLSLYLSLIYFSCIVYSFLPIMSQVEFTLTLVEPGRARMTVPTLSPHQLYHLAVVMSDVVRDGFDLPLTSSNQNFWSIDVNTYFEGPSLR